MPTTFFQLIAKHSGQLIGVAAGSTDAGAQLVQWPSDESDNQEWEFIPVEDGFYNIQAKHSGKVIAVTSGSTEAGAGLVQWPSDGSDNQKWRFVPVENGFYNLQAKHSGLVIGVTAGSTEAGAGLVQWPSDGSDNQQWRFVASAMKMMGMVAIKSIYNRYLQAHDDDGEMHASNEDRHTEETWFLIKVDTDKPAYALQNWQNRKYLSKRAACAPAISPEIGDYEHWILVDGESYGTPNAVAIRSEPDGTFLGARSDGDDTDCGGEVDAGWTGPPMNNSRWGGWWYMQPATTPAPGRTWGDIWAIVKVESAFFEVVSLLASLSGGDGNSPAKMEEVTKE